MAGSNVYDEKKEESRLILKETEEKRQNIIEVLKAIEDRLAQLEVEKEELKEFQKWDKMKRSIEYTIHNKELEHTQNKLNDLQRQRNDGQTSSNELYESLKSVAERVKEIEKKMREEHSKEQLLREEFDQLNNEKSEYLTRKARFELDIKDAEDDTRQALIVNESAQVDLDRLENLIQKSEKRLNEIRPEYDDLRGRELEMTQNRDLWEQKRNEIYAKQGRSTRFRSKEERDQWIKKELKVIAKTIEEKRVMTKKLEQEMTEDDQRCNVFKDEIDEITKRSNEQQMAIDDSEREHFELLRRKDELQTKRNDLWRQETKFTQELSQLKDEQLKCEQNLRSVTGRTLLQGIESIQFLIEQFKQEKRNLDLVDGYYGLLIDNVECDKSLVTAVEASVASRLFNPIVQSDLVAMRFLKAMNQQKLHGEVNF